MLFLLVSAALAGEPALQSTAKAKKTPKIETSVAFRTGDQLTVNWKVTPPKVTLWTTHEVTGTNFTKPLPLLTAKDFKPEMWRYALPREVMTLYSEILVSSRTQAVYGLKVSKSQECLYAARVVERDVSGYNDRGLAIVNTIKYEIKTEDNLACKPKGQTVLLKP